MNKKIVVSTILFATAGFGLVGCSGSSDEPTPTTQPPVAVNSPATFSGTTETQINATVASANGKVDVSDSDVGQASISVQTNNNSTYGSFSIASDGQWTYSLDTQNQNIVALPQGAQITEAFSIVSADGTSGLVVITIVGVNEVPSFNQGDGINAASITSQQSETINGILTITDADTGESEFISQTEVDSSFGTFSITRDGAWQYTLNTANSNVIALQSPNDILVDSLQVVSADATTSNILVTISGVASQLSSSLVKGSIGINDQVPSVSCTTTVSSTSQLEDAANVNMTPGQSLCLAPGNYNNLDLIYGGAGTIDNPITIAAQTPGSVTIGGDVFIGMTGSYVVLHGFIFKDGNIDNSLLQTRANGNTPCNNCRITENVFVNMDGDPNDSSKWFQIYGTGNRFDHNWVSGKATRGALFVIERGNAPGTQDSTQIDHNYFGDRPPKDGLAYADGSDNEYEAIRIGSSDTHTSDSFAVVEHNYFEAIDGEAEVISIKAGKVTVQHNTIRNSRGSIVSRHGEGSTITNNFILGDGNPFSGGIRVVDANHTITNNYISGARYLSTNFNGGLLVSNSNGSTSNGYQDVENVLVANNTVVDSVNSINLYAGSQSSRAQRVYFVNNVVVDAIGPVIRNAVTLPENSTFAGNYVYGAQLGDDNASSIFGFNFIDPQFQTSTDMLMRPSSNSPLLLADTTTSIGDFVLPILDMDGQTRTNSSTAGADETLTQTLAAAAVRGVLSPALVGPLSYNPPPTSLTVNALALNNANFDRGDLSGWTSTNAVLVDNDDERFSGSSVQLTGAASAITQTVNVMANTNYTLSAFIAGKGQLTAAMSNTSVSTDNDSSGFSFTTLSFNTGGNTSVDILAKVDDSVTNSVAIVNADFDNDQNGWVVNEGSGIGQVQDSDNSSTNVNGSIKFTHNDADSGVPYQPYIAQTVNVEPNTQYTLTMYVLLKSADPQDASVLFGVHTGNAIQGDVFDTASIISSKNAVYANLSPDNEAQDSFRPDTLTFNSGANSSITIFAQYVSTAGGDIRIDQFSLRSQGTPSNTTKATFDEFRLVSHPALTN